MDCKPRTDFWEADGGTYDKYGNWNDYTENRFYNYVYYKAYDLGCVETGQKGFDFEQCPTIGCNAPPPPPCCKCGQPPNQSPTVQGGCPQGWSQLCCGSTPILIDTSGNGFELTDAASGVKFDISGKGLIQQVAWTAPNSQNAFLCLPDSNGACDDGKDLFGDKTPQPPSPDPNGFRALAVYDTNGDGVIDSRDPIFVSLRLWIDANHDGVSQPNEIFTLPALGVNSISLKYKLDERTDQYGNIFRYRAQVNPGGPTSTSRMAYDVIFVTEPASGTMAAVGCPIAPRLVPETKGSLR